MTQRAEQGVLISREELVSDIAARVRGYARHLAVVAVRPNILYGVYQLPASRVPRETYVHAVVDRDDGEHGDLATLHLSHYQTPDDTYAPPRSLAIVAPSEHHKPDQLRIFNGYYDDPARTEETVSLHMARRLMALMREFDTLLPKLIPSASTALALDSREKLYSHLGSAEPRDGLF